MRLKQILPKHRLAFAALFVFVLFSTTALKADDRIGALGRILPGGLGDGIIRLSGFGEPVTQINVVLNQYVKAGAPLMVFGDENRTKIEMDKTELALKEIIEIGAQRLHERQLSLEAETARTAREIELRRLKIESADLEYAYLKKRFGKLNDMGNQLVSTKEFDESRHRLKMAEIKLEIAKKELDHFKQSSETALKNAQLTIKRLKLERQINIRRAKSQLELAKQYHARTVLRASSDGTILAIHRKVGESSGGIILAMAQLKQMYVHASIYEKDLKRLAVGMRAEIKSTSLPGPLTGTVETIERIINPQAKVARAYIRLDQSEEAAKFINLEVDVFISPKPDRPASKN